MAISQLGKEIVFPPVHLADENGLLVIGGDLSIERLLLAYKSGIFPWYEDGQPILWWSPDPRFVLYPKSLKISRSLQQLINKKQFEITYDTAFQEVIEHCKKIERPQQKGTWITDEMVEGYVQLHQQGYAHSVEVWDDDELVGGIYGVSLGKCFFGESMFSKKNNSSKVGFALFVQKLEAMDFRLIDCQVYTDHLAGFGAEMIPRERFIGEVENGMSDEKLKSTF